MKMPAIKGMALVILSLALQYAGAWAAETSAPLSQLDPNMASVNPEDGTRWYSVLDIGVEGQGWSDLKNPFDRLPAKAEGVVRDPVWSLARRSAGICVRFVTDSPTIAVRWSLRFEELAMNHMPATGVSGLDLYARDGDAWRWVAVARPVKFPENEAALVGDAPAGAQQYLLYLPLYNGVDSVSIGVAGEAMIAKAPPRPELKQKPICIYGTSITQGGCASRPGMAYTAIVGRHLNWPVINLGFSGNGKAEPEIAALLAELDPALYLIDCLPNMQPDEITERYAALVQTVRAAHPDTPMVLVEHIIPENTWFLDSRREGLAQKTMAWQGALESLKEEGVGGLHVVAAADLFGNDGEATVDGVHPTDVGFMRMAEVLVPVLQRLLFAPQ